MTAERLARLATLVLALGLPAAVLAALALPPRTGVVELRARLPEAGGWSPDALEAVVGEPLTLRLVSDDVVHSFAVGRHPASPVDLPPGRMVETTLTFDRPGRYTFYCTRWCGPDHWRMRGVIEVRGPGEPDDPQPAPYLALGLDLDAPHSASDLPARRPSAARGAGDLPLAPPALRTRAGQLAISPADAWRALRAEPALAERSDQALWDLVAALIRATTNAEALELGRSLYAQDCAACHGESGAGDGVMAGAIAALPPSDAHGHRAGPAALNDPASMYGASPALLHGKIVRGGMGSGMPYFGPLYTEAQLWALVDYLWTFTMELKP